MAFLSLKRQNVPLDRDVILMAVPDEEIGGALGADWMRANHYAEFDPEYIIDEGGFGSRDLFAPGKLVFGISVAEKKILWLKLRAEGIAGHGSQPHDQNPNDRLTRALARLLAEPLPTVAVRRARHDEGARRAAGGEQVQQRDSALDDLDHEPAVGGRRSAEGQRHPVGGRGDARLPRAAGDDEGPVARRDRAGASAIPRSRSRSSTKGKIRSSRRRTRRCTGRSSRR